MTRESRQCPVCGSACVESVCDDCAERAHDRADGTFRGTLAWGAEIVRAVLTSRLATSETERRALEVENTRLRADLLRARQDAAEARMLLGVAVEEARSRGWGLAGQR